MSDQHDADQPKPFRCGECGIGLPITVRNSPRAVRVVCTYCGSRYLAEVWVSIPENLKGNFRIVERD